MRAVLILMLLSTSALADKQAARAPRPMRAPAAVTAIASRGSDLGVWNFRDHYKQGRVEAGLQMHSDFVNVKVTSPRGSRRYYVFRDLAVGPPSLRMIIDVPRRGKVRLQVSPESGWAGNPTAVLEYLQSALGERLKPKQLP